MAVSERLAFVRGLKKQTHSVYFREDLQDALLIFSEFARSGIQKNEKIIFFAPKPIGALLGDTAKSFTPEKGMRSDYFQAYDFEQLPLDLEKAKPEEVVKFLQRFVAKKANENPDGTRFFIDVNWLLERKLTELVLRLERVLGGKLQYDVTWMCSYEANLATEIDDGNFFRTLLGIHSDAVFKGLGVQLLR